MSQLRTSLHKTVIVSSSVMICFLVVGRILYGLKDFRIFVFFFPLLLFVGAIFLIMYISKPDGLKAIFPILASVFFLTVGNSTYSLICRAVSLSQPEGLGVRAIIMLVISALIIFVLRPLYFTTIKYTDRGWGFVDLPFAAYIIMEYMMDVVFDAGNLLFFKIGLEIVVSIVFVCICVFAGNGLKKQEELHRREIIQAELKYIELQSKQFRENEKRISIMRHDMRHNLSIISQLLHSGHVDEALGIIDNMDKRIEGTKTKIYCENIFINAVLSAQLRRAEQNGIRVSCQADIPDELPLDSAELAVVTANIVENSVNACILMRDDPQVTIEPFISIQARTGRHNLIIEVANSCRSRVPLNEEGRPYSDEKDHGIGTISIKEFARKFDAFVDYKSEEHFFSTRVLVNFKEKSKIVNKKEGKSY